MKLLQDFQNKTFIEAVQSFFKKLNVPVNEIATVPASASEIIGDNILNTLISEVYVYSIVDDAIFNKEESFSSVAEIKSIKEDYPGILILGIVLHPRKNGLLPTRNQLSDITRAFNRTFKFTPVTIIFKYENYIALANTERTQFKQTWREGEKLGKVSLLRDIDYNNVHSGHERILYNLTITQSGKNTITSFESLYKHWQDALSVSLLNRAFYKELQDWYFWAIKNVVFPNSPSITDAHTKNIKFEDLVQEHKATNVIRLLTRLLFVWFIKEKKLIPEDLFELENLQKDILKEISPYHETGMFKEANKDSIYYKSILQNLFFATLNCPIKSDSIDKRQRGFRGEGYGTHRGIDYLMRYKEYFKNPDKFLEILNNKVPFLNGGLFECLDDKYNNIYIDGFSDQMTKSEKLIVPDYLFFGLEEKVDLSAEYGIVNKGTKEAAVKGLINILKSYKFTITENTPIEEDVALDPELLGKVFENLLASYNPETKTTARKQTGSFYTPREIVDYMVEESLIAYLKNNLTLDFSDEQIDKKLRELTSFNESVPFLEDKSIQEDIIVALSKCKILDPACGSGAYPMGILQKMVHILKKLDPNNEKWKEVQRQKVLTDTQEAFEIEDKQMREELLIEINNAFDQDINDADYARKLYLIENCIYGVDIQAIATQISKLRFFISLVVEQKENNKKDNFGIRPLPNLETKFVAANTLIGIDKKTDLFDIEIIRNLEKELKNVRHKLFSVKTKETKLKYRELDATLRKKIADELVNNGWPNETAEKLSGWNPYDQNATSPFYDTEWMFGLPKINGGFFDIVIGNPPYGVSIKDSYRVKVLKTLGKVPDFEIYYYFIEVAKIFLKEGGVKSYIIPNTFLFNVFASDYRKKLLIEWDVKIIDCTAFKIFEGATVYNAITIFSKTNSSKHIEYKITQNADDFQQLIKNENEKITIEKILKNNQNWCLVFKLDKSVLDLVLKIRENSNKLLDYFPEFSQGLIAYDKYQGQSVETIKNRVFHYNNKEKDYLKKWLWGSDVTKYSVNWNGKEWIDYCDGIANPRNPKFFKNERLLIREITNPSIFCGFTNEELYHDPANIVILKGSKYDLKVLLAIMNSKVATFYHFNSSPKATKGAFPKILVEDIKNFPIPIISKNIEQLLIKITNEIINNKKSFPLLDTFELENEIDKLVYDLYNLTYDEIALIEK